MSSCRAYNIKYLSLSWLECSFMVSPNNRVVRSSILKKSTFPHFAKRCVDLYTHKKKKKYLDVLFFSSQGRLRHAG